MNFATNSTYGYRIVATALTREVVRVRHFDTSGRDIQSHINRLHNNGMNAEPPTASFRMEHQPRRPGYTSRSVASKIRTIMITDIEEYFLNGCGRCDRFATSGCATRQWSGGLAKLRQICLSMDLIEAVKWGHPCYMHANRNIVIIGALRNDFRLSFFNAALMTDPNGVLEKQGPNTQHPNMIRFTANNQVAKMKLVIESYLVEAIGHAESGIKPPKQKRTFNFPTNC